MTGYGSVVPRNWEFIGSVLGTGVGYPHSGYSFFTQSVQKVPGNYFEMGRPGYGSVHTRL